MKRKEFLVLLLVFAAFLNEAYSENNIPLKVAAVCTDPDTNKSANLNDMFKYIDIAVEQGTHLIVFPESYLQQNPCWGDSSYNPPVEDLRYIYTSAESMEGESIRAISNKAKENDIIIVFGMTEKPQEYNILFNTSVIVGPNGALGKYRKKNLADSTLKLNEHKYWTPGTTISVVPTPIGLIGQMICADMLYFPAPALADNGADFIVTISAWGGSYFQNYVCENAKRAHLWHIVSDQNGSTGQVNCVGNSMIVNDNGEIICNTGTNDGIVVSEIDKMIDPDILKIRVMNSTDCLPSAVIHKEYAFEINLDLAEPIDETGNFKSMFLHLTTLGIQKGFEFANQGNGRYFVNGSFIPEQYGDFYIPVVVESNSGLKHAFHSIPIKVYPNTVEFYSEEVPENFTVMSNEETVLNFNCNDYSYRGDNSLSIDFGEYQISGEIRFLINDGEEIDPNGFSCLEFYINGGKNKGQNPYVCGIQLKDLGVEVEANTWKKVEIPAYKLPLHKGKIKRIEFSGKNIEKFYIDELKLTPLEENNTSIKNKKNNFEKQYELLTLYPNPFNQLLIANYELRLPGHVSLKLYDLPGNEAAVLIDEYLDAGTYNYELRIRDYELQAGMYYFVLIVGNLVESGKIVKM